MYYQGAADNDDLGSLEGQGKTIEEAIDIAQNIVKECGEVEYGIKFISSRKYTKKHTKPTRPSSSKHYKSVEVNKLTKTGSSRVNKLTKTGGLIKPINHSYLITAVNQRGETIPWTTINPTKRKSKYNKVEFYNLYEDCELMISFPVKK